MRVRQCVVCGRDYEPHNGMQKCCGDENCKRELEYWKRRRAVQAQREKYEKNKRENERMVKKNSLSKDAMNAKEAGLTYGQYMALKS